MLRNYFKIAWRNLFRNKLSSLINVCGLAIGMAVAMLIGLWIYDELSFNHYHRNYQHIVQIMDHQSRDGRKYSNVLLPVPLGIAIRNEYASDFKCVAMVRQAEDHVLATGEKQYTQTGNFMEKDAPEMFSLEMLCGTRNGLKDLNSILLSQTLAKKLFGDTSPIGKVITVDAKTDVKVSGVFKDIPRNSEFNTTTFILPFALYGADQSDWNNYNTLVYGQLNEHAVAETVSTKIRTLLSSNTTSKQATHQLFAIPMGKWHLYSTFENHISVKSDRLKLLFLYGIIGVFVLVLACINFMNLSTARSEKRAKEVGIRKAVGSLRKHLLMQFYGESLLIAIFSFSLSLFLVQLALPWFNNVSGKDIAILWSHPWFWAAGILFTLLTALLAGSYPALYLSSFNAVRALKGSFRVGRLATVPRKVLVVVQFSVSIALITGTVFVYLQIQHAKDRPVGYSKAGLITLYVVSPDFSQRYEVLKTEFLKTGVVDHVAAANYPLTNTLGSNGGFYWAGKEPPAGQYFNTIKVDQEYGKTIGWELTQGRDFLKGLAADSASIILNESAVKSSGLVNPVGQTVQWKPGFMPGKYYRIVGVVKDMVKESPFQSTQPSVIFLGGGRWIFARAKADQSMHDALPKMAAAFKNIFPNLPFDYRFVDEEYALKFAEEERIGKLALVFALLAVTISCLGLLGLSSFIAEQRKKEIGIRKILGASVFGIWGLLSKQFTSLVLLACLIAMPVSFYYINGWLNNYSYRIAMSWWVFFAGGAGALLLALLVISIQGVKAASANPVQSLRTE